MTARRCRKKGESDLVFSSLLFIFAYFAVTLLIYYIVPRRGRNIFLFFINLLFYGWGEPLLVFLMVFNIGFNFLGGFLVDKFRQKPGVKKTILILTCALDIGILCFFKYSGMLVDVINLMPNINIDWSVALPIGISFYTFQTMSYVIDVYRNDAPVSKNFFNFGTYVALFPQLIAGPIVRYRDVAYQLGNRRETVDRFVKGVKLFCVGLGKKVLIANQMGILTESMFANSSENGIVGTWVGVIAYTFQIYFDFSGYSDMACGLGNMFGFEFLKNFNYPYISTSITDFWRRWHISLSTWFKEYVYIPLGGNRKGTGRQIVNLLIVWGLTGLWHGAAYNFLMWGLFYGGMLILEKFVLKRFLDKLPRVFRHIYTLFIVMIGWTLFSCEVSIDEFARLMNSLFSGGAPAFFTELFSQPLFARFADMFSLANGAFSPESLSLTMGYLPLLVIAGVASTPLASRLYAKVEGKKFIWIAETLFVIAVLVLSTACLVRQSYNPFLYFRF